VTIAFLNILLLFLKLLSANNQIIKIKYFTALVSGKHGPQTTIKQQTFLRALKSLKIL